MDQTEIGLEQERNREREEIIRRSGGSQDKSSSGRAATSSYSRPFVNKGRCRAANRSCHMLNLINFLLLLGAIWFLIIENNEMPKF